MIYNYTRRNFSLNGKLRAVASEVIQDLNLKKTFKQEYVLNSAQDAEIVISGQKLLNLSSSNYLGMSNHPRVISAAKRVLDSNGFGTSSGRIICGTMDIHKKLEK